jgi:hypothetical protein
MKDGDSLRGMFASGRAQPIASASEPEILRECIAPTQGRMWPDGTQRNQLKTTPGVNDFTYIERLQQHNAGVGSIRE